MNKFAHAASALAVSAAMILCGDVARAQEPVLEAGIPDDPTALQEQYGGGNVPPYDGGGRPGYDDPGSRPPTTQSIEEGLEDAVEDVEPGADSDAVVGTGSYVEGLAGPAPQPAEAAEPAPVRPSETYAELPDTGGVSYGLIPVSVVMVVGGAMLFRLAVIVR